MKKVFNSKNKDYDEQWWTKYGTGCKYTEFHFVKTQAQPQPNRWVWLENDRTTNTTTHPPKKLNISNISGVTAPILTKF